MSVHTYMCTCVWVCMHRCSRECGCWRLMWGVFLHRLPLYLWSRVSHWTCILLIWLFSKPNLLQGSNPLDPLPTPTLILYVDAGHPDSGPLKLQGLYPWSHLPSPDSLRYWEVPKQCCYCWSDSHCWEVHLSAKYEITLSASDYCYRAQAISFCFSQSAGRT